MKKFSKCINFVGKPMVSPTTPSFDNNSPHLRCGHLSLREVLLEP